MEITFGNFLIKLNWLYEAIITTFKINPSKEEIKFNAAPMGVSFQDKDHLILKPFLSTNTFKNIQHFNCAGINFTNNISLFYKAAIKKSELSPKDFIESKQINAPLLVDSKTRFEVISEKINIDKTENRATIYCKIRSFKNVDQIIEPFTRGTLAVLESIIYYTRINFFREQDPEKAKGLVKKVLDYNNFIKRVFPKSDLENIMNEMVTHINKIIN